jgi:hypothetical protein
MKHITPLFCLCRAAVALALVLASIPIQGATSSPPDLMTYQGYLVDNNGTPLGNSAPKNYDVVFRIWKDQLSTATGDRLWAEQQTITIDKGYFSVLLGEGATYSGEPHLALSTLFTGTGASDRFIEVMVKGIGADGIDVTISPRLQLLTSPYAFLTQTAVNAQNLIGGGMNLTSLNANSLTSGTVADARLSSNVPKLNATQTFTASNTFEGNLTVGGDLQIGTSSADYQRLQLGGGNSWGYLYGSYRALGDGIHLGYNYYYDADGVGHLTRSGGATSRLTLGYGKIELATDGNDAAPSTRLVVNASGYVGIGTTTPGFPLNFPNTLGDKISLYGNSGNHYGLGVQSGTLQIHGDGSTSKVVFGYGQSSNLTETMRIQGNGDVIVSGALYGSAPYLKYAELASHQTNLASLFGTNNWRKFNTELKDTHSLGSTNGAGDITLPAGTYYCRISAPAFRIMNHQIRLRTSTGSNLIFGTLGYCDESDGGDQTRSELEGQFELTAPTTLRVQHYCSKTHAEGLGLLPSFSWGDANQLIFAVAEFWKIK